TALIGTPPCLGASAMEPTIAPANMVRIGIVDKRFHSYNIEMVEVTGGNFWKPYESKASQQPSGLFEYRRPIDLNNPMLRRLAAGPGAPSPHLYSGDRRTHRRRRVHERAKCCGERWQGGQ